MLDLRPQAKKKIADADHLELTAGYQVVNFMCPPTISHQLLTGHIVQRRQEQGHPP